MHWPEINASVPKQFVHDCLNPIVAKVDPEKPMYAPESNTEFFCFFKALHTRKNISLGKGWFSLQKLKCFSTMARKTNVETTVLTGDYKNHSKKSLATASPTNGTSVWHVYRVSWVFLKGQKFREI